jgi:hypothetical protein
MQNPIRMTRAIAGWLSALLMMTAQGVAVAQVTAVTGSACQTPVLQNPSTLNPLRLQAGTVSFELWGTTSISATNAGSLFQVPGLQGVELLAVRTATQNSARGCPSVPSVSLRLRSDGAIRDIVSGTLTVPHGKSFTQTIALRMVPHPAVGWIWLQNPVGGTLAGCTMPSFDYQYTASSVLSLKIPFDATLGLECQQRIGSRLVANRIDAHITGPIPVRLTTQLTGLPSVDLPVPIAPDSMPAQIDRPGAILSVPIMLSKNGVLRRSREFPLEVATANGLTSKLTVAILRKPEETKITIGTRSAAAESAGTLTGTAIDFTFNVQPAVSVFSLPITWRVTNPTCYAAVSGPYNPANAFQVFNLQQGGTIFNIRVQALHTAACIPPTGVRTETIEAWAGTDTSVPPAGKVTFEVARNPSL